ncbi:MAG: hypothetical protein ABEJ78_01640 [Haloferacaceae archaeon]
MSNSLSGSEKMKRPSIRLHEDLLDEFDDYVEQSDWGSRNAAIVELMKRELDTADEDDADDGLIPDDERLRDAYLALLDVADERIDGAGLRVTRQEAVNNLYDNRTPKDAVMSSLIHPLKKRGFVDVDPGLGRVWITVRPLE